MTMYLDNVEKDFKIHVFFVELISCMCVLRKIREGYNGKNC
jgi:hypothetical protein